MILKGNNPNWLGGSTAIFRGLFLFTIAISLLFSVATIFRMTIEFDEAWILGSTKELVTGLNHSGTHSVPTLTTGGLHSLVLGLTTYMGFPIWTTARFFSLLCFCGIILLLIGHGRREDWTLNGKAMVLLLALAAPGSLILAGMGYGIVPGVFILLLSLWSWVDRKPGSWSRILITGFLLGLAVATRASLMPLIPAYVIWSLFQTSDRGRHFKDSTLSLLIALSIWAVLFGSHMFIGGSSFAVLKTLQAATGTSSSLFAAAPSRLLSKLIKGGLFIPFPLLLGVLYFTWVHPLVDKGRTRSTLQILTIFGVLNLLLWGLRAPFQHLRYVWPAVFFFYLAGGALLAEISTRHNKFELPPWFHHGCLVTVGAALCFAWLCSLRLILMGAAMETNSWGLSRLEYHFTPFLLIQEEKEMVDFLRTNTTKDDTIVTLYLPFEWGSHELALLSERKIWETPEWQEENVRPSILVTHYFAPLTSETKDWLLHHCDEVARIKGYQVLVPRASFFDEVAPITRLEPYGTARFDLYRKQSLTGRPYPQ
jgi:hypothetical protein